ALNMTGTRIGHLREQGGEIIYPAVRRVVGEGRTLGHLVRWRRLAAGDRTLVQVRELIGRGAVVYLANARGDVWTDLSTSVAPLALRPDTLVGPVRYTGPAGEVLAAAVRVEGTPWSILVAFPFDEILSQPVAFIRWQLGTGLLLLLVATAIALALLGRLTGSLSELADAARAISAGDYGRRTRVEGEDEVGTLGRAFNRMAESVEGAHKQLGAQLDLIAAANERHQRTSERLEHLISSSRAIIYTLQITRTGTELDWISDNILSVLGYTAEEALTPGWWVSNVHPEDRVGHIPPAERPIEEYFQHEYRFRTKDGEYRWIHDEQRSHRREDRQGFEVVGTLTDVTEQRNLQIAKEAAEAAS